MNIYFLVEGEKTEPQVYPQWLEHLTPELLPVKYPQDAKENNYYIISGKGSERLFYVLEDSIKDVNKFGNYAHLVIVIDADGKSAKEKVNEIKQFIFDEKIILNSNCQLHVIVQKYCIETWFLGNSKAYPRNTNNHDFLPYAQFYDVSELDPELMQKPDSFKGSISIYHETYLRKMLAAKNIHYSKANPREVGEKYYLDELNKRVNETEHLFSLKNFFNFCESISI